MKEWNGYKLQNGTAYAKGKKLYKYPSSATLEKLKRLNIREIVYQNGDFICI